MVPSRVICSLTRHRNLEGLTRKVGGVKTLIRLYCVGEGKKDALMKNDMVTIRSCRELRNAISPEFVASPHSKLYGIIWNTPLQNVYVVKKPWNKDTTLATYEFIRHLHACYPAVNVIVNENTAEEVIEQSDSNAEIQRRENERTETDDSKRSELVIYTGSVEEIVKKTDLIVTIGGDGTILRAVSAFLNTSVPPIVSFAMGTLGFLLPFNFTKHAETFKSVYDSTAKALHRSRLECHVVRGSGASPELSEKAKEYRANRFQSPTQATMQHAINDIFLHRGSQPNLISLDIFIDNTFLTTTTGDGLTFATPTGSTAYSLSAGGSIAHPLVRCIIMTPVCPRSLSFRPLILPATSHIMIKLSENNRNTSIKLSIDGIPQQDVMPGDLIHIVSDSGTIYIPGKHDPPPFLALRNDFDNVINPSTIHESCTVSTSSANPLNRLRRSGIWCVALGENGWFKDINELLCFNSTFAAKNRS